MSTWELKENSTGDLSVTVEGEEWTKAQKKAFNKLAADVTLPGFRKGKAPKNMLEKAISHQNVLIEAAEAIAQKAFEDGLKETGIKLVARPTMDIKGLDDTKVDFVFNCTVEPEVKLGEYKGLKYNVEKVTITDDAVNAEIRKQQEKYAEMVEKDAAEKGDFVTLDFTGTVDGVEFEGGKADNYRLELGSGSFIPGFEDQLVGVKVDDVKDVNVTFPEEYQAKELAGKAAVFKCTIHKIEEKKLPELDDDFATDLNMPNVTTAEELKTYFLTKLSEEKEKLAEDKALNELVDKAVDNAECTIPEVMIKDETDQLIRSMEQQLASSGLSIDTYCQITGMTRDALEKQMIDAQNPERRVKTRLVLSAIAKAENIQVSDEEADAEIKTYVEQYGPESEQYFRANIDNIKEDLATNKALDLLKETSVKE